MSTEISGREVLPDLKDRGANPHSDATNRTSAWARHRTIFRIVAIVVLGFAYLLPGIVGHDPWKQDETYTFGIVQHMLESGDLIVPTNAGQPFLEKPPLYAWIAAGSAWLFGHYLPLHDAARLASALLAALTFVFTARAARMATGAAGWFDLRVLGPVALCAGTLVVIKHTHDLMTDVALMAGTAIGFCGLLELLVRQIRDTCTDRRAATMLGCGVGIALMAKGLFVPLVFVATTLLMPVLFPACRGRAFAKSLGVAAVVFVPFAVIWPAALYLRSDALFLTWFWDNNVGRFLGFSVPMLGAENDRPLFVWRALMTVGFPVGPLAVVAIALIARRRCREPAVLLPVVFAGIGMGVLHVAATSRQLYILPFIAPLSLIAADALARMPRGATLAWDYASRLLFGVAIALVWFVWSIMTETASSRAPIAWLGRWLPLEWTMPFEPGFVATAFALTAGWLFAMPLLRRAGYWRGALSWAGGVLVAWGLVYTLLLPWLDFAKSYRSVFDDLGRHVAGKWAPGDCMASAGLGESEAPMLYYFAGIPHVPIQDPAAGACRWLIVQGNAAYQIPGNWVRFWRGARPADRNEVLVVYRR